MTAKWQTFATSIAKLIRFAVLAAFAGLFGWLAYARGESVWLVPAAAFATLALLTLRL